MSGVPQWIMQDAHAKAARLRLAIALFLSFGGGLASAQTNDAVLATARLGARLFLETRFARYFYVKSAGDANATLGAGDPVMDFTVTTSGDLPGPFAGETMNCRACHLVSEQQSFGSRSYSNFAFRSPVPQNGDGRSQTPRNSMSLVNALLPRSVPLFLHFDGEFASVRDLVIGTLSGRNFGWKASENATALSHLVHILRQDNGSGTLAQKFGGVSYAQVFAGSAQVPLAYRISPAYQLFDVGITNSAQTNYVSDGAVLNGVAAVMEAYLQVLVSPRDTNGLFVGSPFDVFLIKNGLPRAPATNETLLRYSGRLLSQINQLTAVQYVNDPADGHFQTHAQTFQFGTNELLGLRIFFSQPPGALSAGSLVGNCIACHPAPAFTDHLFHNTGASQEEYDSVHGAGSFLTLEVPGLSVRETNYDAWLPSTPNHPNATGLFSAPPAADQSLQADLGLWNVFANPDFPDAQPGLQQILPVLTSVPAPTVAALMDSQGALTLSVSNGTPGGTCYLFSCSDLKSPGLGKFIIATNTFDSSGTFTVTNLAIGSASGFFQFAAGAPSLDVALSRTVALFKTPSLRNLGASDPYFHTGRMISIENVVSFYSRFSKFAQAGVVRNGAPELKQINLDSTAIVPLAAFLKSLNEDFQDPTAN